ncbi:MAG: hypothetical protein SOT70_02460 [Lachnospiraceae bacterium]|nr:hypothetical protein [Lachnospiraceae bacterium]
MADERSMNNGMSDIFQDAEPKEQENVPLVDENADMFELLGMSEEEKEKAAKELREEDLEYDKPAKNTDQNIQTENAADNEEDRLNQMLDNMFAETANQEMKEDPSQTDSNSQEQTGGKPAQDLNRDEIMNEEADSLSEDQSEQTPKEDHSQPEVMPDPMDQVSQIINQAKATEEKNEEQKVEPESSSSSVPETEPEEEPLDVSSDILEGIDFNEDLTQSEDQKEAYPDLVEESTMSEKERKRLQKKQEREQKKAEKKRLRMEKKKKAEPQEARDLADDISLSLDEDLTMDEDLSGQETVQPKAPLKERLSMLLFGPEEEEGPTPEEIAKKEAKKAKKAEKKEAQAEKKAQAKADKQVKKNQAKEMAVVKKAAKKDKQEQIRLEEEAEDAKERKVTKNQVAVVAIILILLGVTVVFGTQQFNYHMVVTRATTYFEMQKYKKAYDQIVGVEVKDRDQQIKDKIYCVMYVQQQIDSYHNFLKLQMYENGLDSLIKGLRKYDKHYEEAKELGIEKDLDYLRETILSELTVEYHLSEAQVNEWMQLDQASYTAQLQNYVAGMQFE